MPPITTQELHEHIQASIFGRPKGVEEGRRYDNLQALLHEIVDNLGEAEAHTRRGRALYRLDAMREFVALVEARVKAAAPNGPEPWREAMLEELAVQAGGVR